MTNASVSVVPGSLWADEGEDSRKGAFRTGQVPHWKARGGEWWSSVGLPLCPCPSLGPSPVQHTCFLWGPAYLSPRSWSLPPTHWSTMIFPCCEAQPAISAPDSSLPCVFNLIFLAVVQAHVPSFPVPLSTAAPRTTQSSCQDRWWSDGGPHMDMAWAIPRDSLPFSDPTPPTPIKCNLDWNFAFRIYKLKQSLKSTLGSFPPKHSWCIQFHSWESWVTVDSWARCGQLSQLGHTFQWALPRAACLQKPSPSIPKDISKPDPLGPSLFQC